jgi:hypothetical protein
MMQSYPEAKENPISPEHYRRGDIEPWDFIHDQGLGYLEGNVIKYVCRWKDKNGLEDLKKCLAYVQKLIDLNTNGG